MNNAKEEKLMDLDSGMLLNLSRRIIIAKKDWFDRGVMLNMSRQ